MSLFTKPIEIIKHMKDLLKIIIALLLFSCLLRMPYWYFQVVRFTVFIGFSYLAYETASKKSYNMFFTYLCFALLFQPFVKIALGRVIWNIVDVVIGLYLIYTIIYTRYILAIKWLNNQDKKNRGYRVKETVERHQNINHQKGTWID